MATHKALGRGLNALFSSSPATIKGPERTHPKLIEANGSEQKIIEIGIGNIKPNRYQPRTHFEPETLQELADSIKAHGLAQPLVVTETPVSGHYELVVGERRLRASKMAGLKTVPCINRKLSNKERYEVALIENLQREDLNAMEEAMAIDGLMKEYTLTQDQVSTTLGKSRSAIANILRFLRLHDVVQASLRSGQITDGHAKILAGVAQHSEQLRYLNIVVNEKLSVRDLEALVSGSKSGKNGKRAISKSLESPAEIKRYEGDLQRLLGRRVEVQTNGKKGWVKLAFYSPWDLDLLCARLGLETKDVHEENARLADENNQ